MSIDELCNLAEQQGFHKPIIQDVSKEIKKSVNKIYFAVILGMIGTTLYNLYRKASYFSSIHYKTGLAQKKAYTKGQWGYYLIRVNVQHSFIQSRHWMPLRVPNPNIEPSTR